MCLDFYVTALDFPVSTLIQLFIELYLVSASIDPQKIRCLLTFIEMV